MGCTELSKLSVFELEMYYNYRRIYDAAGMSESEAHIRAWITAKRRPDGTLSLDDHERIARFTRKDQAEEFVRS